MYAVIKTGGKQYKVVAGEKFKVEQIPADIGSEITLDQVLAVGAGETIKFGAPLVEGATTRLKEIIQSKRGPSIFQPYRDIWKLLHKDEIVSDQSSWISRRAEHSN